jgi:ribonuclease PH
MRPDGRAFDELRQVNMITHYVRYPEGSALIDMGNTRVLCNATVQEDVPPWMRGKGQGWVTAEYAMLPRSTHTRTSRETNGLRARTQEIRRLVGRALRTGIDLNQLGERTIIVDCDVIQADGGTRTAAITGGYVALTLAIRRLIDRNLVEPAVFRLPVAAISVGIVGGQPLLDLAYEEDSAADVDFNVVMNASGNFVEVQGTAEREPFPRETLDQLLVLAEKGIAQLLAIQAEALA